MSPLNLPNLTPAFDDDETAECLTDSLEIQCSTSTNLTPISLFGRSISWQNTVKYLGVTLNRKLSLKSHVKTVHDRHEPSPPPLLNKRSKPSIRNKVRLYTACIRPIMIYARVVFIQANPVQIHHLQAIQNKFMLNATVTPWCLTTSTSKLINGSLQ